MPEEELSDFLGILRQKGRVFWNREKEISSNRESISKIIIEELDENYIKDYKIPGFRSYEIFKTFLLPLNFKVAQYPDKEWLDVGGNTQKTTLLGLKGCDVVGLLMLDKVFLDDPEFIDPFYKRARESLIIISSDCKRAGDSCFCNLLGNTPYPTSGFDLNISVVSNGYLLESGSEMGEEILGEFSLMGFDKGFYSLPKADEKLIEERDEIRQKVFKDLKEQNAKFEEAFSDLSKIVSKGYDREKGWALGSTCVSCGACTNACPVCYCFSLFDRMNKKREKSKRFMVWDSCQYKGFSQMAGGMNPRFSLMERFKNRYYHKFFRFHERYGDYKCTGCGRCIDNCLGDIDMREVLAGIKKGTGAK